MNNLNDNIEEDFLRTEILRYLSFWPFFLISVIVFVGCTFTYLRYADYQFNSTARIEILDKSQDSEMALPTAMTIFNRSMINLENEIGILSSYSLNKKVVSKLNSNVKYYTHGRLKTTENHKSEFFYDYDLIFDDGINSFRKINTFNFEISENKLTIDHYTGEDLIKSYVFDSLTTVNQSHELPFQFSINNNISQSQNSSKSIIIYPVESTVLSYIKRLSISPVGQDSDHLQLSMLYPNPKISEEYINTLIEEFDKDGVFDRQLEYKRTIDFVDSRSGFLVKELEKIENSKQEFQEKNNLTDVKFDASMNVSQKYIYDGELFNAQQQKDLVEILSEVLSENKYQLMPANFGIDNPSINSLISQYNNLIIERNKFSLSGVGDKNSLIVNINKQIDDYKNNIQLSIENYDKSLDLTITNLESKENEFSENYKGIPENEKILRSISRELEVKEALFILLLQKREEAAINFAVVKPSIKIIDYARTSPNAVEPSKRMSYIYALFVSLFLPFIILLIHFTLDTKIHTKDDLLKYIKDVPVLGEIPFLTNKEETSTIVDRFSRSAISESLRMVLANLNFTFIANSKNKNNKTILVTSSIKGEGKTIVSINLASILSEKGSRVLLIGSDLRNPQLHKFLDLDKNIDGLSNYIYSKNKNISDYIRTYNKLDILFSGTIPPNPNELLSSDITKDLINGLKSKYDYIVIDSAPCILVSDTFELSSLCDSTIYVIRSNHSDKKICDYINELNESEKFTNLSLVLNGVGNSSLYGYKYNYQYGYKYGYNYGYGYGYGSSADN